MTKIINLFAGPGAGKSTIAALTFAKMKLCGYNCELVTEFAKQMVWQERTKLLFNNQVYVFAKQLHYLDAVVGKVDYIITDSPILLSAVYCPKSYPDTFVPFILDMFNRYDNLNFFIKRVKAYNPIGRTQNEEEARDVDNKTQNFLNGNNIDYACINGNESAWKEIFYKL